MSRLPITEALRVDVELAREPSIAHWLLWRTGRKVGRTIYAQVGAQPADDDLLIGMMDSPRLASEAVYAHNAVLAQVQA